MQINLRGLEPACWYVGQNSICLEVACLREIFCVQLLFDYFKSKYAIVLIFVSKIYIRKRWNKGLLGC